MSYGWLTESSILIKESKKIDIDQISLVDLKVVLMNR